MTYFSRKKILKKLHLSEERLIFSFAVELLSALGITASVLWLVLKYVGPLVVVLFSCLLPFACVYALKNNRAILKAWRVFHAQQFVEEEAKFTDHVKLMIHVVEIETKSGQKVFAYSDDVVVQGESVPCKIYYDEGELVMVMTDKALFLPSLSARKMVESL